MSIRILGPDDAEQYRALRLACLRDHASAFVTDVSEEASLPPTAFADRLAGSETTTIFGAFDAGELVGIATLVRSARMRLSFRATVAGMYVIPSHRRRGVAAHLLGAIAVAAREYPQLEEICISVTANNQGVSGLRRLRLSAVLPRAALLQVRWRVPRHRVARARATRRRTRALTIVPAKVTKPCARGHFA
jgi:GNAT superfamily N-acetyltransferase